VGAHQEDDGPDHRGEGYYAMIEEKDIIVFDYLLLIVWSNKDFQWPCMIHAIVGIY
jgi:hypothetical protein